MSGPGAHSPVGASSAGRGLICALSVNGAVGLPPDEESDAAALGTAVHAVIEQCLREGSDAWTKRGEVANVDKVIGKREVIGAQTMLDAVRLAHPDRNQGNFWVERRFHCKMIHPLFFGTCDVLYIDEATNTLHVWDYKNGAGVIIEVKKNVQTMYYACGALEEMELWDKVERVVLHIVQPNAFHQDGKHRTWETTPEELVAWLEDTLIPGINKALASDEAVSGSHCIFCPVRFRACPALLKDMEELEALMETVQKSGVAALTNDQVGRLLDLCSRADIVKKATQTEGFNRANAGGTIPGYKLAKARAFRKWKDDAVEVEIGTAGAKVMMTVEEAGKLEFGDRCMTDPEFKSPAQIDDLPLGTAFTARWAQSPDKGLSLVKDSDNRSAVTKDKAALFAPVASVIPPTPAQSQRRGGQRAAA